MRESRRAIFMYLGILGVPLIIFLMSIYSQTPLLTTLSYVLLVGLAMFAITGLREVYIHPRYGSSGQPIIKGESHDHKAFSKAAPGTETVKIKVMRFNNDTNKFDESAFDFHATKRTTVLGALLDIKSYGDNSLSVRCNCRMGICGSCGMVVNGKQKLACETNLLDSAEDGVVVISPMEGHPMLKDLVNDFDDFFERHKSVSPALQRNDIAEKEKAKQEYRQSQEDVNKFLPYSYCIMCGLCQDACPVVNTNPNFVGPQALAQSYRYFADSRDQGKKKRLFDADTADGAWGCEFAGACSLACPKGVDPASAIQLLKGEMMKNITNEE